VKNERRNPWRVGLAARWRRRRNRQKPTRFCSLSLSLSPLFVFSLSRKRGGKRKEGRV